MNSRDPFGLRRSSSSALAILKPSNAPQVIPSDVSSSRNRVSSATSAIHDPDAKRATSPSRSAAADDMSFTVPHNVPSFTNPQRRMEDSRWGSSGNVHSRGPPAPMGSAARMGGLFERRELPMYKDKPYNYGSAGRRRQWWRRKRIAVGAFIFFIGFLYWLNALARSSDAPPKSARKGSGIFSWLGGGRSAIDWDERREKVKDAFIRSWDTYEKYAWGKKATLPTC